MIGTPCAEKNDGKPSAAGASGLITLVAAMAASDRFCFSMTLTLAALLSAACLASMAAASCKKNDVRGATEIEFGREAETNSESVKSGIKDKRWSEAPKALASRTRASSGFSMPVLFRQQIAR